MVRQADDRFLPATTPQFTGIARLANTLDIVEQPYLAANELADPARISS